MSYDSDNHETLIVNQLNLNPSNIVNYALTFSKDFEKIEESMIIKTINLDDVLDNGDNCYEPIP